MKNSPDFDHISDCKGLSAMKYELLQDMFGRRDLTPLWIADMDFECPACVREAVAERMSHPSFCYTASTPGYWQSIIDWLGRRHGITVSREQLTFANGVVKAIAYAVNFFTEKGQGIITQEPVYHPFRMVIEGNGRHVVNNELVRTPEGYRMDLEDLELKMARPDVKMMILCNPHNPAGIQWDADTLRSVAALAKRHGVVVVSDEIHGDLMLWGKRHIPFISVSPEAAEVGLWLGAPSKTFNIPAFMSSWMMAPNPALREPFFKWLAANEFSDPCFTSVIAAEAAYKGGEQWLDSLLPYIEENIRTVEAFCTDNMPLVKPLRPDASFLVWLDMRDAGMCQKDLMHIIVDEAHLALNDGTMFGPAGKGYIRLNVATPRTKLLTALEAINEALKAHTCHPVH